MRRSLSCGLLAALWAASPVAAQSQHPIADAGFGVCVPRSQRAGHALGCFIVTDRPQPPLGPAPVFWHVTRFRSRAQAEALRDSAATVIEAFGQVWLMTIGDSARQPGGGVPVATIGPLPIRPGVTYSALYMEASMLPGMKTPVHRHSGPEAWYTLRGETCLETPRGVQTGTATSAAVIAPGGLPMQLTATGTAPRRSLVLILHDAAQPPTVMDSTWTPRGLCAR